MSISAVSGSIASVGMAEMMQQARRSQAPDPDEMAQFIVEQDDQDGDGLLSLDETPLDEDRFNEIDTDGDGYITAEELSADAQSRMGDGSAPPPPPGMQGMFGALGQMSDPDEIAQSIVEKDDQDGDGLLSLDETPLDEDRFNEIDADGDGYITAEELSADAQSHMESMEGMQGMFGASESGAASAASAGSSESEDSEEYDQYDLNQDGVVTSDELLQAYQRGDLSLSELFGEMDRTSPMAQRLGIQAYEAQMAAV